jgi:hypothetical protein
MRFEYIIPAFSGRREVSSTTKADSEQHMRAILRSMYGHDAAVQAIVRPVPCGLHAAVKEKGCGR